MLNPSDSNCVADAPLRSEHAVVTVSESPHPELESFEDKQNIQPPGSAYTTSRTPLRLRSPADQAQHQLPPAATLDNGASRPMSFGDSSLHPVPTSLQRHFHHQRNQSSSELRPSATFSSPSTGHRRLRPHSVDMPFTGDNRTAHTLESASRGMLAGWLPGSPSSTDAEVSIPLSRSSTVSPSTFSRIGRTPNASRQSQNSKNAPSPSTSRFAFLSSLSSLTKSTPAPAEYDEQSDQDGLLSLNIQEALFPDVSSPTGPRDAFSPAAFKNLEAAATALLTKFQTVYRQQSTTLKVFRSEREAQADEIEEMEMRTRHLKLQLENMARQALDQEQEMKALRAALEKEKMAGREVVPPVTSDGSTIVSEDLGAEDDQDGQRWSKTSSSSLDDTDEESICDSPSVFSRSRSPANPIASGGGLEAGAAATAAAGMSADPATQRQRNSRGGTTSKSQLRAVPPVPQAQPQAQTQISAFQKLVRGITGETEASACRNCEGLSERAAWDTVSLLREENRTLKTRVAELESCVEGALDVVNGLRLE
ncbi:hypothetical protein SODALDRAFT_321729 [Sodiomyces alkalinus F11]|uniref:Uncharacterized protein n=1 Tax=Sodiomyces alkalinus (strain CBS 110278 / VKM F-3762 / F11) TaxID=1314773 RepID=A0A3N2Q0S7_SODAK|nr:hypothetical protein SODALDRAFT_321729 [Sodiomyces alkalinus F11]ROT40361.1 hypothetical protein SODALDRAFT_321729 [Sodiomyces alkalinus F11]